MIDTLLEIVSGSQVPYRSDALTLSDEERPCDNYAIAALDCDGLPVTGVYANIIWNPIQYLDEIEGEENYEGVFTRFYHKKKGTLSFNCLVNETFLGELQAIAIAHSMSIRYLPTNDIYQIQEMEIATNDGIDVIQATVSFTVIGADEIITTCCQGLFDRHYEECDPVTRDPVPQPMDCDDFVVGITADIPGGTLTATSSGGPGGVASYQWFLDAGNGIFSSLSETAGSIALTAVGTYRVQVTQGGCTGTYDFLYDTPCADLEILITQVGDLIVAEPNFEVPAGGYDWYEVQAGPTEVGPDVAEHTNVYAPANSGTWRVKVTHAVCGVIEADIVVALSDDCGSLDFDLVRVDNALEIQNETGCSGNTTYAWHIDRGAGSGWELLPSESGPSLNLTEVGLFRATLTCDSPSCAVQQQVFVLDNCVLFRGWIDSIVATMSGVTYTAGTQNVPFGASVNYAWYEWIGGAWQLIGTGMTLDIADSEDPANIKLVVSAGTCIREDYSFDCIDPSDVTPYEAHYSSMMETTWGVTAFTLEQPDDQGGALTQSQVNAKYRVTRNGLVQRYLPLADMATTMEQNVYSYSHAAQQMVWPTSWPLYDGDRTTIADLDP